MSGHVLLQVVLAVLALYHVGAGAASLFSFAGAKRIARAYGASIEDTPQLRYTVRMLGLYALTLGALLAQAAMQPYRFQPVIYAVAGLQLARAACRVLFRRELDQHFGMPMQRNALGIALLLAEAAVLLAVTPGLPRE